MKDFKIGEVISALQEIKLLGKLSNRLTPEQIDALNAACNILESNYDMYALADNVIKWEYWRE